MSEQMIAELIELLNNGRKLHKEAPFLSDFENGCNEGANDVLDDMERILSKYVDIPIPKNEIEILSKQPKIIWGRIRFGNNNHTNSYYEEFIKELKKFDTIENIVERKNDKTQWDEFQDAYFYWIDALFSEIEANHLLLHFKDAFTLLEVTEVKEDEFTVTPIEREWLEAFIAEEKTLYGETPSASSILANWKRNKDYFLANKGKPFGVVKVEE